MKHIVPGYRLLDATQFEAWQINNPRDNDYYSFNTITSTGQVCTFYIIKEKEE